MEIKYQTVLNNNLVIRPTTGDFADGRNYSFGVKPLTIDTIVSLEVTYNSGNPFPASLRELLFLAGQRCHVLDYGLNDTQVEMQEDVREDLVDRTLNILTRPYFVIDMHRSDAFLFVYLDEGVNDPMVYQVDLDSNLIPSYRRIMSLQASLSSFVGARIASLKSGLNPF